MSFLTKLFLPSELKQYQRTAKKIVKFQQTEIKPLSDLVLKQKVENLRKQLKDKKNKKQDEELLIETYAIVREMAGRQLGLEAYPVQLMGAIGVAQGKIIEMKTGEGKTLTISFPTFFKAITGKGVHVITVNDYLAKRDAEWIGPVYAELGLSIGVLQDGGSYIVKHKKELAKNVYEQYQKQSYAAQAKAGQKKTKTIGDLEALNPEGDKIIISQRSFNLNTQDKESKYVLVKCSRQQAYEADVTYGTNKEFGFDYLRDNMEKDQSKIRQTRSLHFAIIDEIDSVLIDEAQTPLIISQDQAIAAQDYLKFNQAILKLQNEDYLVDEKEKTAVFTEPGISKLESILGINIYDKENIKAAIHAEMALRAHVLFQKDRDYIIQNNRVIIIDENTGRMMSDHKYAEGIHQAIEAKEGLLPGKEAQTLALITLQNYFKLYEDFSGLTGTAMSAAPEFYQTYNKKIVAIPTNKPIRRADHNDLIYKNTKSKATGLVNHVLEVHNTGQPVLVGTSSIKKSEIYNQLFKISGVKATILNAKHHEKEARIIAQAGKKNTVTVATNVAGRGTDIGIKEEVALLGGLEVIGTERSISHRIDNQLIGRAGRQGNPGGSQFHICPDDELIRYYLPNYLKKEFEGQDWGTGHGIRNKKLTKLVSIAQNVAESVMQEQRKRVYEQDEILDVSRRRFYNMRKRILSDKDLRPEIYQIFKNELEEEVVKNCSVKEFNQWQPQKVLDYLNKFIDVSVTQNFDLKQYPFPNRAALKKGLNQLLTSYYESLISNLDKKVVKQLERSITLEVLDSLWLDYLKAINFLDETINLMSVGNREPIVEFRLIADRTYQKLETVAGEMIMRILFKTLGRK